MGFSHPEASPSSVLVKLPFPDPFWHKAVVFSGVPSRLHSAFRCGFLERGKEDQVPQDEQQQSLKSERIRCRKFINPKRPARTDPLILDL